MARPGQKASLLEPGSSSVPEARIALEIPQPRVISCDPKRAVDPSEPGPQELTVPSRFGVVRTGAEREAQLPSARLTALPLMPKGSAAHIKSKPEENYGGMRQWPTTFMADCGGEGGSR